MVNQSFWLYNVNCTNQIKSTNIIHRLNFLLWAAHDMTQCFQFSIQIQSQIAWPRPIHDINRYQPHGNTMHAVVCGVVWVRVYVVGQGYAHILHMLISSRKNCRVSGAFERGDELYGLRFAYYLIKRLNVSDFNNFKLQTIFVSLGNIVQLSVVTSITAIR